MRNWFAELNEVNVGEHTEKKNGLTYLSWAWAWTELKKRFPMSRTKIYENENGENIWRDPVGAHVKASVTIVWEEEDGQHEFESIEYLPVMDFKNKSVPYESIDSMMVNKTVQRCLTKCIARLGLGMYIYAGEDLPEESEETKAAKEKAAKKVTETIGKIDAKIKTIVSSMTTDQKKEFAINVITPIIGNNNYKTCEDINKLEKLLEQLMAA